MANALDTIEWQAIPASPEGDWINQRSSLFATLVPLGTKASASRTASPAIFALYSAGLQTNRDSWVYNYSASELVANTQRMILAYNDQVRDFVDYCTNRRISDFKSHVDEFIDRDPTRISWSRSLKARLARRTEVEFNDDALTVGLYRPFNKQRVYFDRYLNHERSQLPRMFPTPRHPNLGFYCVGTGSDKPFSVLMTDQIPDLALWGSSNGQFFPRYAYHEADDLLGQLEDDGFQRVDNVTDAILASYRKTYGEEVTKDDIFFYAYGLLHSPTYRARFESDLKKLLPRIPMVKAFRRFVDAGRKLAKLHVDYESVEPYQLQEHLTAQAGMKPVDVYRVEKMTFGRGKDRSQIIYNAYVTVSGIPEDAYQYTLGARSAIEWIIDRYQVTTNKDSKIRNDPNDWSSDPRYILDLLKRVVTVSVETMKVVDSLPEFEVPC